MIPTLVLIFSFVFLRAAGWMGVATLDNWSTPLRIALAVMFFLTASAHWGRRRPDLIEMVPRAFPRPDLIVTATGVLETLGAVGLLIPPTVGPAAIGLAALMIAMFPANVRASREKLTIGGRPVPGLAVRTAMQLIFLAALIAVGVSSRPL
jgi:uncharacterized membrane protein